LKEKKMYKNWNEIVKLGKVNTFIMMGIAHLDPTSSLPEVKKVMEKFPECFVNEEVGPVPLSYILEWTRQEAQKENNFKGEYHPGSYKCVPSHVPLQEFWYGKSECSQYSDIMPLPESVSTGIKIGGTFGWMGEQFVVLENNLGLENIYAAPVECILVDIDL
jgi:hypothetical protein